MHTYYYLLKVFKKGKKEKDKNKILQKRVIFFLTKNEINNKKGKSNE